ncbi:MAG: TAXI family TRAP transporter solute-binding subunit [Clostridia bacterium]|nr:TAXI family TRAP transporter solute-binding subunit [Clostridia bacterium]
MKKLVSLILCLALCLACVASASAAKFITIGTAGTAGALYPMGIAMAQTITDHVDGISATGEATAASIQNLRDLHEGNSELGISQSEVAFYAYNGQMDYEGNAFTDIRALYSTIYNFLQVFVPADSDIHSIADLKGKTVSMGSAGSGGEMAARALLSAYGLDYTTVNAQFMGESDGSSALKDGKIDAMIATHPLGSAAMTELTTSMNARLLAIEADDKFYEVYPLYTPYTVPAGTYNGQDADVVIPRSRIIMCTSTNSGLTDDEIYEIVKAVWENRDEWAGSAKSVETQAVLETALEEIAIPMHPGAIRFFEEIGVEVPEALK